MKRINKNTRLRVLLTLFILTTNALFLYINASEPKDGISFQEYLSQVGKNNLSYLAERYNIQIADAEIISSKVMPDPEFNFEALNENLDISLTYDLELGNKRGARVRLAKSQAEIEKLSVEFFFQELRAEASSAFVEAMTQKDLLEVKRSSYEYMLQLSKSDSIRFNLGEITENEARQSKIEATLLLNEMYQQEAEYKSSLATLNQYMGKTIDFLDIPLGTWSAFDKSYLLPAMIESALDSRIDLKADIKKMEMAANELKVVKAERKMNINLMVGYERGWNGRHRYLPSEFSMLKAGFSIPLKFSNTNKGAIKSAEYVQKKVEIESQNTQLQVQKEVAQAYYNYEASQKQVREFDKGLLEDSKKLLDGIIYKYKRGETNILEVLMAQRTYNEVQVQYLETLRGNADALIELQKACGIWDIVI